MDNGPVVVMGMGPSGLFITRQLCSVTKNIYAIGREDDVGMFSKYIMKNKRYYAQSEDAVYEALKRITSIEMRKPEIYLCSDQYLTMLVNAKRDWNKVAYFPGTSLATLRAINNKEWINQYCAENSIKVPPTIDMREFVAQSDWSFPVIIKWKEKGFADRANPIGKALVCQTADSFNTLLGELKKTWVTPAMLLVQTYIPGNNDFQYSVGAVYSGGKPLASVTVKQIKQYPQGISAQVYTVEDKVVKRVEPIARCIAEEFEFSGFLETEFKIDERTEEVYLLDVNPRPWGWVSILAASYKDFYRVLDGKKLEDTKQNAIWTSPIRTMLSRKNKNNVNADKNTKHYNRAYDIYNPKDRAPSYMVFFMGVKKMLKR